MHLARGEFAQQFRSALKVRSQLRFNIRERTRDKLLRHRFKRRHHLPGQVGRQFCGAAVQLIGLRIKNGFEPAVQFIQRIVICSLELRGIFPHASRRLLNFGKRGARARNFFVEDCPHPRHRFPGVGGHLRQRRAKFGDALGDCLFGSAKRFLRLRGQLRSDALYIAVERRLQEFIPLRFRNGHFSCEALFP